MTIAKRKLVVQQNELSELFNLPEGVEILSAKVENGEIEFLLVSGEEISTKDGLEVTVKANDFSDVRRISLESLKSKKLIDGNKVSKEFAESFAGVIVDVIKKMDKTNAFKKNDTETIFEEASRRAMEKGNR